MIFKKRSLIALAVVAGCAAVAPACSNTGTNGSTQQGSEKTGTVSLAFTSNGETITSFNLAVTGPQNITRNNVPVGANDATISAFLGDVLAGGYTATVTATSTSGDSCTGSKAFTVTAGAGVGVTIPVVCTQFVAGSGAGRGSATIDAGVTVQNNCPSLTEVDVEPLVGDKMEVNATASSTTGVAFAWTSTGASGSFASPSSASTEFDCSGNGSASLMVTLTSPGHSACTTSLSIPVKCVDTTGGTGGAGGAATGGAATGGAATGGAATGGAATGGAATGGAATGGSGGTASICTPPQAPPDPTTCSTCEVNNCTADAIPSELVTCDSITDPTGNSECNAILDCVRTTSCIHNAASDCFCGVGIDVNACKNDSATPGSSGEVAVGDCKAVIRASFATGTTNAVIVPDLPNTGLPVGAALSLATCDHNNCGSPALGGNNECFPYCR